MLGHNARHSRTCRILHDASNSLSLTAPRPSASPECMSTDHLLPAAYVVQSTNAARIPGHAIEGIQAGSKLQSCTYGAGSHIQSCLRTYQGRGTATTALLQPPPAMPRSARRTCTHHPDAQSPGGLSTMRYGPAACMSLMSICVQDLYYRGQRVCPGLMTPRATTSVPEPHLLR